MYKINILKKAQKDLDWFRRNDKNSYIKSFDLVRELMSSPRKGTGKPERLKYFEKEVFNPVNNVPKMIFGTIKSKLRKLGKPTGEMDALIAATAMSHKALLVTRNRKHFENIESLKVDSWPTG